MRMSLGLMPHLVHWCEDPQLKECGSLKLHPSTSDSYLIHSQLLQTRNWELAMTKAALLVLLRTPTTH